MLARAPRTLRRVLPQLRSYVVSIDPPLVYAHKSVPRLYSERKTYLYNQYTRLLQSSPAHPLVFFTHTDFTAPRLIQLRRDIVAAATRHAASLSAPAPAPTPAQLPTLTFLRTSLFGVALRDHAPLDAAATAAIASLVSGGLAVLSFPALDPPQLNAVLRALARAVPARVPPTPAQAAQAARDASAAFVPGRRAKRVRARHPPELRVVGALVEGRVFAAERVPDVTGLPTLAALRAQLVGLLSAPAAQLALVLGEAGGGRLARTLEGFRKSLEEGDGAPVQGP